MAQDQSVAPSTCDECSGVLTGASFQVMDVVLCICYIQSLSGEAPAVARHRRLPPRKVEPRVEAHGGSMAAHEAASPFFDGTIPDALSLVASHPDALLLVVVVSENGDDDAVWKTGRLSATLQRAARAAGATSGALTPRKIVERDVEVGAVVSLCLVAGSEEATQFGQHCESN